jgi:hypothetical protein
LSRRDLGDGGLGRLDLLNLCLGLGGLFGGLRLLD